MDFLYINKIVNVLAIMNSYSRKIMPKRVENEDAHLVLDDEFILQTDGRSHFANELMTTLLTELRVAHKKTIVYAPFTNGSIENSHKGTLKFIR